MGVPGSQRSSRVLAGRTPAAKEASKAPSEAVTQTRCGRLD